eukprot:s94_g91.t1
MLSLHGSIPRGLLQVGIIVDDLVILEQVLRREPQPDGSSASALPFFAGVAGQRLAAARDSYAKAGLINNPAKGFENQLCARFSGLEMDGDKGLMRASSLILWPVCLITVRVIALGLLTIGCLKSEELISELSALIILGTLAVVNLRADYYNLVVATDASGDCMAAATAECPPEIVSEVAGHTLKKGIWAKMLPGTKARDRLHGLLDPDDEVPGLSYRAHPLWDLLSRSLTYKCAWREIVRRPMHINLLELKAYLKHERRIASRARSKRILYGMDSLSGFSWHGGEGKIV